ncbi:hypothetical protein SDC9_205806 [bioreactor metagenome]|uniref:Uncharacterized protein n=1 Tax=bioreactor metagenome TaxID=1076179 RepID=A0A645J312_9ZZZZ
MRNSVVITQLNDFGIDQHKFHFIRFRPIQHADDNAVDANALSRTGRAGDEHMRHAF